MTREAWRRIEAHTGWTVEFGPLPTGILGTTNWTTRTVTLALGQYDRELRFTIHHECEHVERGPIHGTDPIDHAREERRIDRIVAVRLLPSIDALADELIAANWCLEVAAEALYVDTDALAARLGTITNPTEQAYMRARINDYVINDHPREDTA